MSQANLPKITPVITITTGQSFTLLLTSIALEELALAHIVNAEAEKIQDILGTLTPSQSRMQPSISDLLTINNSVIQTLGAVVKKEMLLQMKLEQVMYAINNPLN